MKCMSQRPFVTWGARAPLKHGMLQLILQQLFHWLLIYSDDMYIVEVWQVYVT